MCVFYISVADSGATRDHEITGTTAEPATMELGIHACVLVLYVRIIASWHWEEVSMDSELRECMRRG